VSYCVISLPRLLCLRREYPTNRQLLHFRDFLMLRIRILFNCCSCRCVQIYSPRKFSSRNSVILFSSKYLKMSRKFSNTAIIQLPRPMGMDPFPLCLVLSRRPCGSNMASNGKYQLGSFPRELYKYLFLRFIKI